MSKRTGKKARERLENEIRLTAKQTRLTPQNKNIETLIDLDILKGVENGKFTGATMLTFKPPREQTRFFSGPITKERIAAKNKLLEENKNDRISNDANNFLIQESHKMVCPVGGITDKSKKEGFIHFRINPKISREVIHYLIDMHLNNDAKLEPQKHKGRFRGEQIQALEVWEEWINSGLSGKKGFPQIAKKLHLPLSTVKTLWYRAHAIVLGKKYVKPLIDKEDAKNKALELLCSKCKDIQCYKEQKGRMERIPCAAYLKIAPKDYTQELLTGKTLDYSNSEESFSEEAFLDKLFPEEDS